MKKKRILVTGGAGFVGSHLCEELVKNKRNLMYSLDNYFTGTKKNHIKGVKYFKGSTKDIEKLIKFRPDLVYHLGEYARVEKSLLDDFSKIFELNKIGTEKVLEFCLKHKTKLVYAGSSTKFADGGLARDATPYAWTKATNTELVKNFGAWYGLKYAIVYFYNVTGGRERSGEYGTLLGIFRDKYLKGEVLGVVRPGTQKRNFTHINDIVSGLILVGEKGEGDDFGIGDRREYSVIEIAEMFGGQVRMLPERKGNRMENYLNTSKLEELGWKVRHSVKEEIEKIKELRK
jgi:UDP-glucose 4-epimerase